jgi:hypothetical protein
VLLASDPLISASPRRGPVSHQNVDPRLLPVGSSSGSNTTRNIDLFRVDLAPIQIEKDLNVSNIFYNCYTRLTGKKHRYGSQVAQYPFRHPQLFSFAVQFKTTDIGCVPVWVSACFTGVMIRNRWPSRVTS